ncbi:hypothetical protein Goshw_023862 [Gossypium schwendimanii]|uniref:DUF7745 domain-containing protein n=1 Tax=Gossypium schwendimanii TaxID=34291 RepID=A0A7J9N3C4_GOSSC|nr:hypothetical protein [Gossypium schwendimanii]
MEKGFLNKVEDNGAVRTCLKDAILTHPYVRMRLDVFALSIYDLVVFPKALGYVDEAVTDLFDWLDKNVTPILAILAETFRSLSACQKWVRRKR